MGRRRRWDGGREARQRLAGVLLALATLSGEAPAWADSPSGLSGLSGLSSTARAEPCDDPLPPALLVSPAVPVAGAPLRLILATDGLGPPSSGAVGRRAPHPVRPVALHVAEADSLVPQSLEQQRYEGPPGGLVATLATTPPGALRIALEAGGQRLACATVAVSPAALPPPRLTPRKDPVWRATRRWDQASEDLYSLWLGHLFAAPREAEVSWPRLAAVLSDTGRNALAGHLGLDEDRDGLGLAPDCADFPYVLRAYFAWKVGLPMGYRSCTRGSRRSAPRCKPDFVAQDSRATSADPVAAFRSFVRGLRQAVHASTPRPDPTSEASDLYPVALTREALRPGAVYADPYGHVMVLAGWYPQTATTPGALMAVDAQPDETVGRRLFWRGNFLFPSDDGVRGAGWRRFRPVIMTEAGPVMADNAAIAADPAYGDVSQAQWEGGREAFYARMDALANPAPMAVAVAVEAALEALSQQATRRVEAVAAAGQWLRTQPRDTVIAMPETGAGLFLTVGPWEDFSTPSRDLRLLIALDVVRGLPERLAADPQRFVAADPEEARRLLAAGLEAREVRYEGSDGEVRVVSLAGLMARATELELGWNPNDCPEVRWGAPAGSAERRACRRRAPRAQRDRMEKDFRRFFHQRERP